MSKSSPKEEVVPDFILFETYGTVGIPAARASEILPHITLFESRYNEHSKRSEYTRKADRVSFVIVKGEDITVAETAKRLTE